MEQTRCMLQRQQMAGRRHISYLIDLRSKLLCNLRFLRLHQLSHHAEHILTPLWPSIRHIQVVQGHVLYDLRLIDSTAGERGMGGRQPKPSFFCARGICLRQQNRNFPLAAHLNSHNHAHIFPHAPLSALALRTR